MAVSALREITIGVQDLPQRAAQFVEGCAMESLASGALTAMTAGRLFDSHLRPKAARLGRPDIASATQLRLVETAPNAAAVRSLGAAVPGPLAITFSTRPIHAVRSRLAGLGLKFISEPTRLTGRVQGGEPWEADRHECLGASADGDFVALSERIDPLRAYGTLATDCSEPVHTSFVVTNLDACLHFMTDVLEHRATTPFTCDEPEHARNLGFADAMPFRTAVARPLLSSTGSLVFLEFESRLEPMSQTHGLSRGLCRLRYDTTDLHETLARVPGGGGSLVRGPASVDDPVLGRGLVAMVRAPFGVLIEIWQTV